MRIPSVETGNAAQKSRVAAKIASEFAFSLTYAHINAIPGIVGSNVTRENQLVENVPNTEAYALTLTLSELFGLIIRKTSHRSHVLRFLHQLIQASVLLIPKAGHTCTTFFTRLAVKYQACCLLDSGLRMCFP